MEPVDLDALFGPENTPRRLLPNGVDPWRVITGPTRNTAYANSMALHAVEITCECCGKQWKVHPCNAKRTWNCSQLCNLRMWRARRAGKIPPREATYLSPRWHNPDGTRKEAR